MKLVTLSLENALGAARYMHLTLICPWYHISVQSWKNVHVGKYRKEAIAQNLPRPPLHLSFLKNRLISLSVPKCAMYIKKSCNCVGMQLQTALVQAHFYIHIEDSIAMWKTSEPSNSEQNIGGWGKKVESEFTLKNISLI